MEYRWDHYGAISNGYPPATGEAIVLARRLIQFIYDATFAVIPTLLCLYTYRNGSTLAQTPLWFLLCPLLYAVVQQMLSQQVPYDKKWLRFAKHAVQVTVPMVYSVAVPYLFCAILYSFWQSNEWFSELYNASHLATTQEFLICMGINLSG